jgi:hypothetical protein
MMARYNKVGDTIRFRSSWEANCARLFDYLGITWEFEPKRFYLTPTLTYLPDFKLGPGNIWNAVWLEVKGFWHKGDRSRIRLFRRMFPEEPIHVVSSTEYLELEKKYSSLIPGWEFKNKTKHKKARRLL